MPGCEAHKLSDNGVKCNGEPMCTIHAVGGEGVGDITADLCLLCLRSVQNAAKEQGIPTTQIESRAEFDALGRNN